MKYEIFVVLLAVYLIKYKNDKTLNKHANKSFRPAIQTTALVKTGWTAKISDNIKAICLDIFNSTNNKNKK